MIRKRRQGRRKRHKQHNSVVVGRWKRRCEHGGGRVVGLTLTELVVVCAIIAVLVGIVWVVMAPAREKARQAVCISNLRQIGHAFRMYRDDWDGVEPEKGKQLEYWELGLPPTIGTPIKALSPYLKNKDLWLCPSRFLIPNYPTTSASNYLVNYCTHQICNLFGYQYDLCELRPGTAKGPLVSFKWLIAKIPDLPVLYCDAHKYFYSQDWLENSFCFGIVLPDFSVQQFQWIEYAIKRDSLK